MWGRLAGIDSLMSKFDKIKRYLWGRYQLRGCTSLGQFPQVDGKVFVRNAGTMRLGERVKIRGSHLPVELATFPQGELVIGDGTSINSGTSICAQESVIIGKNCLIGNYNLIMDTDFHEIDNRNNVGKASPVRLGDNVWLGAHVTVLKGVTIGEGAVVSAGSVVGLDVAPYTLVGGVPARLIRKITNPADPGDQAAELNGQKPTEKAATAG